MPKVAFSQENVRARTTQFPKLKLKKGETARLLLLEPEPESMFVHTLQAPVIEGGVPQYEVKKRKDGTEYPDHKMEFVAKTLCLGDYETIDKQGSDPSNCPMCKAAADGYGKPPQRRFATNVIKYRTKVGSTEVTTPFSVDVVVWEFGDRLFNDIFSLAQEWADDGGLKKHDLSLGPCTNEGFQQADLNILPKAAWLASKDTQSLTVETFKENRIEDLELAMGSKKELAYINSDIKRVRDAWNAVKGADANGGSAPTRTLDEGLDDLLDVAPSTKKSEAATSVDDFFEKDAEGWAKENPEYEAATATRAEELPEETVSEEFASSSSDVDDLDALLNGL